MPVSRFRRVARSLEVLLPVGAIAAACGGASSGASGLKDGGAGADGGYGFGSSGGASGGGGASSGALGSGPGVTATCIVGTRGCLCDTTGGCASGLTCTPQGTSQPSLCCSGSNCASATSGGIGATCGSVATAAACTPGITVLEGDAGASSPAPDGDGSAPAMGTMPGMPGMGGMMGGPMGGPPGMGSVSGSDGCGYAASSFAESTTLCAINAVGGGSQPAVIQVFYSDEHALTLGCATSAFPVSALPADPGEVSYPQTGDPACTDVDGRPLRPVLYVTDITADPTCTAGDQQNGGTPYDPVAIFGTWKSATEDSSHFGTPATADPGTVNVWDLGSGADAVPSVATKCAEQGYSTELRFEVGLVAGHSYRFQVIVHDGDQNKGGDSGEACAVYCAGGGSSCPEGVATCTSDQEGVCPDGTFCMQGCCLPNSIPPLDSGTSVVPQ